MDDEIFQKMILEGAIEVAGMDMETGEMLYTFTDKLAQFSPPMHQSYMSYIHSEIMFLWENGFLEMDVTEANPTVRLTEKVFDEAKIDGLSPERFANLKEIIRSMIPPEQ